MSRNRGTGDIAEEVSRTLRKAGFRVEFLSYPTSARSIDIIACRGDTRVFIKVSQDLREVSWIEVNDLKKSGMVYGSNTVIVAEKNGRQELEDDVVYVRNGVNIVTTNLLGNYLLRNSKPIVVNIRGNYLLKISAEKFHVKMKETGLTRGELAELLGVSRKAIYMYERGELMVSLQRAVELARIMGEDIFEEIDILGDKPPEPHAGILENEYSPSDEIEATLWRLLDRLGDLIVKLSRTPVDIVVKGGNVITVTRLDKAENKAEKLENAEKLVKTTGSKLVVIRTKNDLKEIRDAQL